MDIIVIDGCEYIRTKSYGYNNSSYAADNLVHKAKCKNPMHKLVSENPNND